MPPLYLSPKVFKTDELILDFGLDSGTSKYHVPGEKADPPPVAKDDNARAKGDNGRESGPD
jgi:hypothetical protein